MNTQTFLHLGLTVHLIALTMAVGVTIANAIATNQFWKLYDRNSAHGLSAFRAIKKFQVIGMIGLLLLILSGITMLWLYNWAYGEQLWFKIKMTCILLLLINGFTVGRITTLRFERMLMEDGHQEGLKQDTLRLRTTSKLFHLIQLSLFAFIIILASFRFT
jgi:hypothetical protein